MNVGDTLPPEVRRRFAAPAHLLPPGDVEVADGAHSGLAGVCEFGTQVRFVVQVRAGRIAAAGFRVYGCPYTVAACDWLAEQLVGRSREQGIPGTPEEWARALAIPLERLGSLFVLEDAVRQCF